MNPTPGLTFESRKYKGHTIELVQCKGWSDTNQSWVSNGFRINCDGPHFNTNQHTYLTDTRWIDSAIDAAIAKTKGGAE